MEILDKIQKLKYERARTKYLRQVTQNIGTIEEREDSIICYVKQDLLEKNSKRVFYELHCDGMNTVYDKSRELVDYYKLNKPVYYIFDGIYFDTVVSIASSFSNIIFKNCTFNSRITIFFANTIILENNRYNSWTNFKDYGNAFLYGTIKNLTIKNEQFMNHNFNAKFFDNNFGINIEADKVNIDSSAIYASNHGQINIKAKETKVCNSRLHAPEIYLDLDSITFDESSLLKADGIIIENKNCDFDIEMILPNIDSPYVVYNGTEMLTNYVKDEGLKEKRLTLVKTLTNVINKCNQSTLVKSASTLVKSASINKYFKNN